MQFFSISIHFLIDCTEKSLLCLFCATKVVIICAKIWHSLQQNVEIVNGGGKNQQGARKNTSLLIPNSPTCLPKVWPAYRRYGLPAEGTACLPQVGALFHYRAHRLSADTTIVVSKYVVVLRLKLHEFRIVWGICIERT